MIATAVLTVALYHPLQTPPSVTVTLTVTHMATAALTSLFSTIVYVRCIGVKKITHKVTEARGKHAIPSPLV